MRILSALNRTFALLLLLVALDYTASVPPGRFAPVTPSVREKDLTVDTGSRVQASGLPEEYVPIVTSSRKQALAVDAGSRAEAPPIAHSRDEDSQKRKAARKREMNRLAYFEVGLESTAQMLRVSEPQSWRSHYDQASKGKEHFVGFKYAGTKQDRSQGFTHNSVYVVSVDVCQKYQVARHMPFDHLLSGAFEGASKKDEALPDLIVFPLITRASGSQYLSSNSRTSLIRNGKSESIWKHIAGSDRDVGYPRVLSITKDNPLWSEWFGTDGDIFGRGLVSGVEDWLARRDKSPAIPFREVTEFSSIMLSGQFRMGVMLRLGVPDKIYTSVVPHYGMAIDRRKKRAENLLDNALHFSFPGRPSLTSEISEIFRARMDDPTQTVKKNVVVEDVKRRFIVPPLSSLRDTLEAIREIPIDLGSTEPLGFISPLYTRQNWLSGVPPDVERTLKAAWKIKRIDQMKLPKKESDWDAYRSDPAKVFGPESPHYGAICLELRGPSSRLQQDTESAKSLLASETGTKFETQWITLWHLDHHFFAVEWRFVPEGWTRTHDSGANIDKPDETESQNGANSALGHPNPMRADPQPNPSDPLEGSQGWNQKERIDVLRSEHYEPSSPPHINPPLLNYEQLGNHIDGNAIHGGDREVVPQANSAPLPNPPNPPNHGDMLDSNWPESSHVGPGHNTDQNDMEYHGWEGMPQAGSEPFKYVPYQPIHYWDPDPNGEEPDDNPEWHSEWDSEI